MKKVIISFLVVVLAASGLTAWAATKAVAKKSQPAAKEPFVYASNKKLFTVTKKEFQVISKFTPSLLMANACDAQKTNQYFKKLLAKYTKADKGIEYDFKYIGAAQGDVYIVTVIPNKLGYAAGSKFKNDFAVCAAGEERYPFLISKDYLLFDSSCGSGFDDGSGKPHGCDLVKAAVKPAIKF